MGSSSESKSEQHCGSLARRLEGDEKYPRSGEEVAAADERRQSFRTCNQKRIHRFLSLGLRRDLSAEQLMGMHMIPYHLVSSGKHRMSLIPSTYLA